MSKTLLNTLFTYKVSEVCDSMRYRYYWGITTNLVLIRIWGFSEFGCDGHRVASKCCACGGVERRVVNYELRVMHVYRVLRLEVSRWHNTYVLCLYLRHWCTRSTGA